jgi:hypothetical protein
MGGFGFDGYGFSLMGALFPVMFFGVFILVIGTFIVFLVKGLSQWSKNNASPVLTVEAKVVAKRADVSDYLDSDSDGMTHRHSNTSYYVTFQVESGDRMELHVPDQEFGMLAEGDRGRLTFQGTRYQGFSREL